LFIRVDSSQLENALLNLTINARDAMSAGGTITISATKCHYGDGSPPDDYVLISVTDTGSGIRTEDLKHVYEPFFTTKDVGKGSGLGLSMVYSFTQQSNGKCEISSTLGKGTTVSMYFPAVEASRDIDIESKGDKILAADSEVILVVEDEPRVRRVVLRDLENLGYRTLEAEDAAVARKIIESGEPVDLLFTDVLMPGEMNGRMLGVWTADNYPEIKVILTSGYSKDHAETSSDEAHAFPMVRKPYSIDKLAEQIRTILTK
jgi:CheY-like chemotaxis protein